jgi:MraZ protein
LIFRGTFEHTLDAKHRLTVPAKYRGDLSPAVVLAVLPESEPGSAQPITMWRPQDYEAYVQGAMAGMHPLSRTAREMKRVLLNNSYDVELDSANRVMIPERLMEYAGLTKDVVITGSGECLEVWDRTTHAAYNDDAMARFPQIVERFDHTD